MAAMAPHIHLLKEHHVGLQTFRQRICTSYIALHLFPGTSTGMLAAIHKESEVHAVSAKADIIAQGCVCLANHGAFTRTGHLKRLHIRQAIVIYKYISHISGKN